MLRPYASFSKLEIWDFFTQDFLGRGPWQDCVDPDEPTEEDFSSGLSSESPIDGVLKNLSAQRKSLLAGYGLHTATWTQFLHNLIFVCRYSWGHLDVPCSFAQLLEIHRLAEEEVGYLPQFWQSVWQTLNSFGSPGSVRNRSYFISLDLQRHFYFQFDSGLLQVDKESRSHLRLHHKKSTLDLLIRGKMIHSSSGAGIHQGPTTTEGTPKDGPMHRFDRHAYNKPTKVSPQLDFYSGWNCSCSKWVLISSATSVGIFCGRFWRTTVWNALDVASTFMTGASPMIRWVHVRKRNPVRYHLPDCLIKGLPQSLLQGRELALLGPLRHSLRPLLGQFLPTLLKLACLAGTSSHVSLFRCLLGYVYNYDDLRAVGFYSVDSAVVRSVLITPQRGAYQSRRVSFQTGGFPQGKQVILLFGVI